MIIKKYLNVIKNNYIKTGGKIMSMLMTIGSVIIIIALAATLIRNPNHEHKNLLIVLLVLMIILTIVNVIW